MIRRDRVNKKSNIRDNNNTKNSVRKDKVKLGNSKSCFAVGKDNVVSSFETLGYFAGGIAHDFNNILSIIEGYTEIAIKRLKMDELTEEYLNKLLTATERGAGITRQLLAFGTQKVYLDEIIDIVKIIQEQEHIIRMILGGRINLKIDLPNDPVYIVGCEDNITQIITNLTVNARDAMNYEGNFIIEVTELSDTSQARIKIQDDGCGIRDEIKEQVFQPFFTTKESGQGTGLGLSFVYGLVEQMGGDINLCSREGIGTRFEILLPLSKEKPAIVEASSAIINPANISTDSLIGKTILIAEDEPDLRAVLEEMFTSIGLKVLCASNGNEALLVQEDYMDHIDFLLTDVVMPEMHGAHLAELFKSLRPDTYIVFMSGYPAFGYEDKIRLPEDALLISKPIREEKLSEVLIQCLKGIKKQIH